MTHYIPYKKFLLRTPLLSISEIKNIKSFESSPAVVQKALSLGAPSFYRKLKTNPEKNLQHVFLKYLLRMATRVQSYSLFSSISLGTVADKTEFDLADRANATLFTEAEIEVFVESYFKLTPQNIIDNNLKIIINPTAFIHYGKYLKFYAAKFEEGSLKYYKRQILLTPFIKRFLTLLEPSQSASQACKTLQKLKLARTESIKYLMKLLELQILQPSVNDLPTKKDYTSLKMKTFLQNPISTSGAGYLYRPTSKCTLSRAQAMEVIEGCEVFLDLVSHKVAKTKAQSDFSYFVRFFGDSYNRREIPLLEAVHLFSSTRITHRAKEAQEPSRFDKLLLKMILEKKAFDTKKLNLTKDDIKKLIESDGTHSGLKMEKPHALSISAQISQTGEIYYNHILGPPLSRHFSRFAFKNTDINNSVSEMLNVEKSFYQNIELAELQGVPSRVSLGNVGSKDSFYTYNIAASVSDKKNIKYLSLSDLNISYWNSKLRIRSSSLNKEVLPVLNGLYSAQLDGNPVYSFLYQLLTQNSFNTLSWTWGDFFDFDFLPRVSYKNFIYAPALWKLKACEVTEIKKVMNDPNSCRSFLINKKIPLQVALQEADRVLCFDLENIEHLRTFIYSLRSDQDNVLYECLQNPFKNQYLNVTGPEGPYFSDIILPCFKRDTTKEKSGLNNYHLKRPNSIETSHRRRNVDFEQGCVYIKIYADPEDLKIFLSQELFTVIKLLKQKKLIASWFFINYFDGESHVRLRLFAPKKKFPAQLIREINKLLHKHKIEGVISKYVFDTYEPEIERYGGPYGIKIFEKIFNIDSETVLEWETKTLPAGVDSAKERLFFTLLSLDFLLESFLLTTDQKLQLFESDQIAIKEMDEFKEYFGYFRDFRDDLVFIKKGTTSHLLSIRSKRLRPLTKLIRQLISKNAIGVGLKGLLHSLLHMHLNRLGYLSLKEEQLIRYFIKKMLYARKELNVG